jgi:alternate signal-mediated exported protein
MLRGFGMNKMIKGSIAGATGVALLMGGFGTYAVWSDEATQSGDSITSGTLDVAANSVSWTDNASPANTATGNDWNLLMVPGDVVTRTQTFTFAGTGKNLKGAIKFVPGAETEPSNAANAPSLADTFNINAAVTGLSLTESAPGSNCWLFTTSPLAETATTTVTYALNADNQDLQGATASIANSTFTVTQNGTC